MNKSLKVPPSFHPLENDDYFTPNTYAVSREMWWKIGERKNDSLLTNSRRNNMDSAKRRNKLLPFQRLLTKNISDKCHVTK